MTFILHPVLTLPEARSAFQEHLVVRYIDGRTWELVQGFTYVSAAEKLYAIPAGTLTDFASIPRALWPVYNPAGPWGRPAVLHDWLYRTNGEPRKMADRLFLEAMIEVGVAKATARTMYAAVRLFGRWSYRSSGRSLPPLVE